jgi:hypothetical protein
MSQDKGIEGGGGGLGRWQPPSSASWSAPFGCWASVVELVLVVTASLETVGLRKE